MIDLTKRADELWPDTDHANLRLVASEYRYIQIREIKYRDGTAACVELRPLSVRVSWRALYGYIPANAQHDIEQFIRELLQPSCGGQLDITMAMLFPSYSDYRDTKLHETQLAVDTRNRNRWLVEHANAECNEITGWHEIFRSGIPFADTHETRNFMFTLRGLVL